jgi:integrase/recombinase XerC
MKPPHLPEQPVSVVRAEQLVRLLKTCEGRDFTSRRDTAIILCWSIPACAAPSASA